MSTNLKVIKFTAILSGILVVFTYLIGLNISYDWFDLEWLSNNFLITILGGAFASSLVVLLCEIQKYLLNKCEAENVLWNNTVLLYSQFLIMNNELEKILDGSHEIQKGILLQPKQLAQTSLNNLMRVDYKTFKKKQQLFVTMQEFHIVKYDAIGYTLRNIIWLDWAINQEIMDRLVQKPLAAEQDSLIHKTILKLKGLIFDDIKYIEQLLLKIDYSGKYNSKEKLKLIKDDYSVIMTDADINVFLSKNICV